MQAAQGNVNSRARNSVSEARVGEPCIAKHAHYDAAEAMSACDVRQAVPIDFRRCRGDDTFPGGIVEARAQARQDQLVLGAIRRRRRGERACPGCDARRAQRRAIHAMVHVS
jgi:hypothetical protein